LIAFAHWRIDLAVHGGASMNLKHLCDRIVSSMLALGIGGCLVGLGAHSASAQSITVTTPFPYCVNNQAYPRGEYKFNLITEWLLSIRSVDGGGESLFQVQPEVGVSQGLASGPEGSAGGVTFRAFQGFRELQSVHAPGSDLTFKLAGRRTARDKSKAHGSLQPINCFTEASLIRSRKVTGQ
jgi:hypothetical protein